MVALHLLLFAAQTGVTTLTCVADMVAWTGVTWEEKWALGGLYGPYLALGESSCSLGSGVGGFADRGKKRFLWGWIVLGG